MLVAQRRPNLGFIFLLTCSALHPSLPKLDTSDLSDRALIKDGARFASPPFFPLWITRERCTSCAIPSESKMGNNVNA